MKKLIYILLLIPFGLTSCGGSKEQKKDALHLQREAKDALFVNNDISTANHLIDNAIELAPSLAELYITKADLLIQDSLFDDAIANIDKAIERKNTAEYQMMKGFALQAKKDTTQAITTLNTAIEMYDIQIEKGIEKEDALYYKYMLKIILSSDKESNIAELENIMKQDSTLDIPVLEAGIASLRQAELEYLK